MFSSLYRCICIHIYKHAKKHIYIQKIYLPFVIKHRKSATEHYVYTTFTFKNKITCTHFINLQCKNIGASHLILLGNCWQNYKLIWKKMYTDIRNWHFIFFVLFLVPSSCTLSELVVYYIARILYINSFNVLNPCSYTISSNKGFANPYSHY